jgi:tRNA(adenine34) deaminase
LIGLQRNAEKSPQDSQTEREGSTLPLKPVPRKGESAVPFVSNEILEDTMKLAIHEARLSLREGNRGFGAAIMRGGEIVAKARDTDNTTADPTAHAEMNAIRSAAAQLGGDLEGCVLVSTHEPCPMCATAVLWSGIGELAYGYSIKEALAQGRKRVDLPCREIFDRAGKTVRIHEGVLHGECSVLYDRKVRESVRQLRNASEETLEELARELSAKRVRWFQTLGQSSEEASMDPLDRAYHVFLRKLDISSDEAPIVRRSADRIVIHSNNFCPTLEACRILNLDTRFVCRRLTEKPTTELLRQVDPRLRFSRNYDRLRPNCEYCEETILLETPGGETHR